MLYKLLFSILTMQYFIIAILIWSCVFYVKKKINLVVILLLIFNVGNELFSNYLKINNYSNIFNYNIYSIIHNYIWLYIISKVVLKLKQRIILLSIYLIITVLNLFVIGDLYIFNFYNFILGAFIYLMIFLWKSCYNLLKNKLVFFTSNYFILLSAPLLFLLGLSLMFAFHNKLLIQTLVFKNTNLYTVICYTSNFVYYTLIAIYFYREKMEKKLNN